MRHHYLNLSNGIYLLNRVPFGEPWHFLRLQSTACEQKRWGPILDDIDYGLLVPLAAGAECIVYDCGARKPLARALWQGIAWVRFACETRWTGASSPVLGRGGESMRQQFGLAYQGLPASTLGRLDYAGRFYAGGPIRLLVCGEPTAMDGDTMTQTAMVRDAMTAEAWARRAGRT
jgi:hypothetical protein